MTGPGIVLASGTRVEVAPPVLPPIQAAPPTASPTVLVPVIGPRGPKGDPGDAEEIVFSALLDVDAPAAIPGVLARDDDGVIRPRPVGEFYSRWFHGDGPPPNFVPGARPGDLYKDDDSGRLYQL